MNRFVACILPCALVLGGCIESVDACRHTADRSLEESMDGIARVVVEAGAGELRIRGDAGQQTLQARGRACAGRQADLDGVQLRSRRERDALHVIAEQPGQDRESDGLFDALMGGRTSMDVTIDLPAGTVLDVRDSSGELDIKRTGSTTVDDSSGAIWIEEIDGNLRVQDSSGAMEIERVAGDVHIPHDSSGAIEIRDVQGSVLIDEDSSGAMHIGRVGRDVIIRHDSSGEISVSQVKGRVEIEEDGSGAIHVSDIGRDVAIGSDGSGEIVVRDVQGDFTVDSKGSGSITHERIGGNVRVPGR